MKKKNIIILFWCLLLMFVLTACGDKDKIKGEWTVSETGFDDNGNYNNLTSQTFANTTIFPGTTLQFDDEICAMWSYDSSVDTYLNYHLQDGIIFFEKDEQEYPYTFEIDGDTLIFENVVTSQTVNSDGTNDSDGGTMRIICTRNTDESDESDESDEAMDDSDYANDDIEQEDARNNAKLVGIWKNETGGCMRLYGNGSWTFETGGAMGNGYSGTFYTDENKLYVSINGESAGRLYEFYYELNDTYLYLEATGENAEFSSAPRDGQYYYEGDIEGKETAAEEYWSDSWQDDDGNFLYFYDNGTWKYCDYNEVYNIWNYETTGTYEIINENEIHLRVDEDSNERLYTFEYEKNENELHLKAFGAFEEFAHATINTTEAYYYKYDNDEDMSNDNAVYEDYDYSEDDNWNENNEEADFYD